MKTIKWNLLAIICVSLMSFTSCDSDDDFRPESSYMEALAAKYPNATYVEWDRKGEYHVADCRVDNKDLDVWFSATAEWKMTETDLLVSDLPAAITQAIAASEYADWFIDEVDLLEYPSKAKEYVIEVERNNQEMNLYYSETGELIRTKDVTTGDDTHWPESTGNSNTSSLQNALMAKYPTATQVEWERKGDYHVADCYVGKKELDVWFTAAAEWKMTETDLLKSEIPAAITTAITASEYAGWIIDDVDLLEYSSKTKEYVIEVERNNQEMDLYYSETGELLHAKDVTITDDTHWPE